MLDAGRGRGDRGHAHRGRCGLLAGPFRHRNVSAFRLALRVIQETSDTHLLGDISDGQTVHAGGAGTPIASKP